MRVISVTTIWPGKKTAEDIDPRQLRHPSVSYSTNSNHILVGARYRVRGAGAPKEDAGTSTPEENAGTSDLRHLWNCADLPEFVHELPQHPCDHRCYPGARRHNPARSLDVPLAQAAQAPWCHRLMTSVRNPL